MRIPRIYYEHTLQMGKSILLDKDKTHYIKNVLRLKRDDLIILFNGDTFEYTGQIKSFSKTTLEVDILNKSPVKRESPLNIHLGQVLSKKDKMDFTIQKSTELGVNTITPLLSDYCDIKIKSENVQTKHTHWQNVAISASCQSGRTSVPPIFPICPVLHWIKNPPFKKGLVLHPEGKHRIDDLGVEDEVGVIIGPEGGFSMPEIETFQEKGLLIVSLGPRILRTETASLAIISLLQHRFGDLNPSF